MSERLSYGIPPELLPLFEAHTPHEALSRCMELIKSSDPEKQLELLRNSMFVQIVESIFAGLDECRMKHVYEVIHTMTGRNQALTSHVFLKTFN